MSSGDPDIDSFIRQQKAKLANERQILNNNQRMDSGYQEIWRQQHGGMSNPGEENRSPRGTFKYQRSTTQDIEDENDAYKKTWFETTGKYLQPGGNSRRQWSEPVKLSPRGYLDTNSLIQQAQNEKEEDEYKERWKQEHPGQEPSPRANYVESGPPARGLNIRPSPPGPYTPRTTDRIDREDYKRMWEAHHPEGPNYRPAQPKMAATRGGYLDTGSIVREVQREKMEEEEQQMRMRGGQGRPQPYRGGRPDSQSEYQKIWQQQQQQRPASDPYGIPKEMDESEDFGLFHNLGAEDKRRKLHKDSEIGLNLHGTNNYTIHCRKHQPGQSNLREQTDDHKVSTLLANQSDAAKLERMKERNKEYRDFLQQKTEKDNHRFDSKKPPSMQYSQQGQDGVYNTLPGLRYSNSAQMKKEKADERNREYNDLMKQKRQRGAPPAEPRQGWGTPTYEEILGKKREEEAGFRRANDAGYQGNYNARENNPLSVARGSPVGFAASKRAPNQQDGEYFASLPIGGAAAAEVSQKENYARELRQQMEEARMARKMERQQGSLVNNNGFALQNGGRPPPNQGAVLIQGGRTPRGNKVQRYHTDVIEQLKELDSRSPRGASLSLNRQNTEDRHGGGVGGLNLGATSYNRGGGGYNRNPPSYGDPGLGIDMSILERPAMSSIAPPAGLQYQPS